MKTARYAGILLIALYMILAVGMTAFATEDTAALDSPLRGSIAVDLVSLDSGETIVGGTLTLYQVAKAEVLEGEIKFTYTDEFAQCGMTLTAEEKSESEKKALAETLEAYVEQNNITGQSAAVDESGHAAWTDLEHGLYLVVQTSQSEGYAPIQTFVVSVPESVDGAYIYEINAKPKTGTTDTPDDPTTDNKKTVPSGSKLPQTGQLWWPVPVLAIVGILCVFVGWYRKKWSESADENR